MRGKGIMLRVRYVMRGMMRGKGIMSRGRYVIRGMMRGKVRSKGRPGRSYASPITT